MSCDAAAAAAAFILFAQAGPGDVAHPVPAVAEAPASVASEPLFADIVKRAGMLRGEVQAYRQSLSGAADVRSLPHWDAFSDQIGQLADLDEKGHVLLVSRGVKDDLKCILHGISQDLPGKLAAVTAAKSGHDEDNALRDMDFLLRDNVEVITAPPQPAA
jgi:hypothetical protein